MKALCLSLFSFLFASNAFAHGMSEEDKAKALEASLWEYIELGATHMITGYDHLLFLFGVIFFLTRFKDIVKFITAFTIGHSITLVFATLYHIQANYFLVDAVIALTVMYKGFDNLDGFKKYLNVKAPSLLWMVFAFGLIHGFGLSTRLQMLPLPEEDLVMRILAFNVGVEFGQIAALSVMLFLLSGWRKMASFKKFSNATNSLLIFVGFLLLLMQLHGYLHSSHPEEYPVNKDDHAHIHEDWQAEQPLEIEGLKAEPSVHDHGDGAHSHGHEDHQSHAVPEPEKAPEQPKVHTHGNGKQHDH